MEIIKLIKKNEGFRAFPYKCSAGKLTIAWGRNIEDRGISTEEAELMLRNDIDRAKADLYKVFGDNFSVSTLRYNALVDMMYNLGLTRFSTFKKMIGAIKEENWVEAKRECLDSYYAMQVPKRAERNANYLEKG